MPIDPEAVGATADPVERTWGSTDCLLYAVGVGAGQDPADELAFTTENTAGVAQQALPTMAVVLAGLSPVLFSRLGPFDLANLLHAAQEVSLDGPLPVEGRVRCTGRIAGIYDKGKAALVVLDTDADDAETGQRRFTVRTTLYLRGEGGWGGEDGPPGDRVVVPEREADDTVVLRTRPEQALIYRLSGDRNPLHSDPGFARRAGLDRPILHGLCTFGFTGRALLRSLCGGDGGRLRSMAARFTAPVLPGDELAVSVWRTGDREAVFQTRRAGDVVLDGGRCAYTP